MRWCSAAIHCVRATSQQGLRWWPLQEVQRSQTCQRTEVALGCTSLCSSTPMNLRSHVMARAKSLAQREVASCLWWWGGASWCGARCRAPQRRVHPSADPPGVEALAAQNGAAATAAACCCCCSAQGCVPQLDPPSVEALAAENGAAATAAAAAAAAAAVHEGAATLQLRPHL